MPADAMVANLGLGHGRIFPTEQVLLGHPQFGAGLDHVDGIDGLRHVPESAKRLSGDGAVSKPDY